MHMFICYCLLPATAAISRHFLSGKAHVPVATYAANLQGLVDQLLAAGVERVVLATPPPVFDAAPQAIPPGEVCVRLCWEGHW